MKPRKYDYTYYVEHRNHRTEFQHMMEARSYAAQMIKQSGETITAFRLNKTTGEFKHYGQFGQEWVDEFMQSTEKRRMKW